jgi:hypothetical protein
MGQNERIASFGHVKQKNRKLRARGAVNAHGPARDRLIAPWMPRENGNRNQNNNARFVWIGNVDSDWLHVINSKSRL